MCRTLYKRVFKINQNYILVVGQPKPSESRKNMNAYEKLLKRLPNKYHEIVEDFYAESGLIDDCKYMLLFSVEFRWDEFESIPCNSITEAINFIKSSEHN